MLGVWRCPRLDIAQGSPITRLSLQTKLHAIIGQHAQAHAGRTQSHYLKCPVSTSVLGFRSPVSGKISCTRIRLVAEPWWVNLAILVPLVAYFSWRHRPVPITAKQLLILGVFASAFGFLEATVVVYLRAAAGLLPGYRGTLSDVARLSQQSPTIGERPPSLLTLEVFREAATLLMLSCAALLTLVYYAALWATIRPSFDQRPRRFVPDSRAVVCARMVSPG
jgi:hypothetical protein